MGGDKRPRWTDAEKAALVAAVHAGLSMKDIMAQGIIPGRNPRAAYDQLHRMGVTRATTRWVPEDLAALKAKDYGKLYERFSPRQIADKERALERAGRARGQ